LESFLVITAFVPTGRYHHNVFESFLPAKALEQPHHPIRSEHGCWQINAMEEHNAGELSPIAVPVSQFSISKASEKYHSLGFEKISHHL
jgi:hypothetical protein